MCSRLMPHVIWCCSHGFLFPGLGKDPRVRSGVNRLEKILDVVPHGRDLGGRYLTEDQVTGVLAELNAVLLSRGYQWRDVSLIIIANSKATATHNDQSESDQNLVTALDRFCAEKEWFPPAIGASTFSMFFRDGDRQDTDISDGILFVAVVSAVLRRIPVGIEITDRPSDRKYAGRSVLEKGVDLYCSAISDVYGIRLDRLQALESSSAVLFTTGSGHIEANQFIDFKDVYAVGQELFDAADEARIIGGCATNRTSGQWQCLYYSEQKGQRIHYRYTYNHAAVLCLLPYAKASCSLRHPYRRMEDVEKLEIEFDKREQYADGRYFYIRTINGRPPVEFLADYWDFTREELLQMAAEHTALPAEPKAHLVTIASSRSKYDNQIWPNVPIWLDKVGDEIWLRLVRAEPADSNYYLMNFEPEWLNVNARELASWYRSNFGGGAALLTFLCESRKYVLNSTRSNREAEEIVSAVSDTSPVVGIYLNGEYSFGIRGSIGYHNYSQIAAALPYRDVNGLPFEVATLRESSEVTVFVCHSSRDKALVSQIVGELGSDLGSGAIWIDETKLITGEEPYSILEKEIRSSNQPVVFLMFISASALRSEWVLTEVRWAIERASRRGDRSVFPIFLDDVGTELTKLWDPEVVKYIGDVVTLRVVGYTDDVVKTVGRRLSAHVKEWVSRMTSSRPPTEFATLRWDEGSEAPGVS